MTSQHTHDLQHALQTLKQEGQYRQCHVHHPASQDSSPAYTSINGNLVLDFSSNDYLGLSQDPRLIQASIEATQKYGTSTGSARLICGTTPLHQQLETQVARWKETEAALVFNSGYQANVGILQALLSPHDRVFMNKLNHASLVDGCRLSKARLSRYKHGDMAELKRQLEKASQECHGQKWIVTDTVFSMDGDCANLSELVSLAETHEAFLLLDDAHGAGVLGPVRSSGWVEEVGLSQHPVIQERTLQMGTFSKALGSFGAYIAGSSLWIQWLMNKSRSFIYSTSLPPGVIGASLAALELIQTDTQPKEQLHQHIRHCHQLLNEHPWKSSSLETEKKTPIIPLILGSANKTMAVSQALQETGFFLQGIRPPTVPTGRARLRLSLSAHHSEEDLTQLVSHLYRLSESFI